MNTLLSDLTDFEYTLNKFNKCYQENEQKVEQGQVPAYNPYAQPNLYAPNLYAPPPMYMSSPVIINSAPQPVVINNVNADRQVVREKEKEQEKKEQNKKDQEQKDIDFKLGLIGAAITALICTYTLHNDEYVSLNISEIDEYIAKLKTHLSDDYPYSIKGQLSQIIFTYEQWRNKYTARSKKNYLARLECLVQPLLLLLA